MPERPLLNKFAWMVGAFAVAGASIPTLGLSSSVSEAGINAQRLHEPPYNLIGRKIAIGAVDIGRPRKFGWDKSVQNHREIPLQGVFFQDTLPKPNATEELPETMAQEHAEQVAAVMISSDKASKGVAPGAKLYAAGVGRLERNGQPEECVAAQHLAGQNGGDLRAINLSFGESLDQDPRTDARLDGNALLTQCLDWSARVHDVLYVVAGNQGSGGIPIPTDNYNGVNVAFSTLYEGMFRKVDLANVGTDFSGVFTRLVGKESNVNNRRLVSIVAPGSNLELLTLDGQRTVTSGTSFAAPHVTATVALLQEYGDRQLSQKIPQWTLDARRHQVMKAVLLNSADKIKDQGDGLRLGMGRDLLGAGNRNWLDSDAYKSPDIPLDGEMGSGHLDAFRAYEQCSAGQWIPAQAVPALGWDYHEMSAKSSQDYVLEAPHQSGSFVAVTLTWNRLVELNDSNGNKQYDLGESFTDRGLNDLNLYLMPAEENNTSKSISASTSQVDSTEHIFFPIPKTGRYKIRVQYAKSAFEGTQPYALAWWTVPSR